MFLYVLIKSLWLAASASIHYRENYYYTILLRLHFLFYFIITEIKTNVLSLLLWSVIKKQVVINLYVRW